MTVAMRAQSSSLLSERPRKARGMSWTTAAAPMFRKLSAVDMIAAIRPAKTTPASTEIFEEGLYLPVCKLYQEAEADEQADAGWASDSRRQECGQPLATGYLICMCSQLI